MSKVQPKFIKGRTIPYALQEKVNIEISISPRGYSGTLLTIEPYGSPIVRALKKYGSVSIYGDYKLIIKIEQHPLLPRIKDLHVVIGGDTVKELKERIILVLKRLKHSGFTLTIKKYEFCKNSIEYLRFRTDENGLHSTDENMKTILKAPKAINVKELQSFLGFVNYLAKIYYSIY